MKSLKNVKESRLDNVVKNTYTALISQVVVLVLGFVSRGVLIRTLGNEYAGINGLFTNILAIISLAELGLGTSMIFTYYKPFEASQDATRRVQPLLMVDELVAETTTYNELLILEKGKKQTDFDKDIPELQKIALYCVDKISNEDVAAAKINGVGIFLVNSKDYLSANYEVQNLYRNRNTIDYYSYNYFNGYYEKELHEKRRLN